MYIKNPDTQPGKPNQSNVSAIENQLTGGAQPIYGTGQSQTAYGPNFSAAQSGHSANNVGDKIIQAQGNWTATIGAEKAVPPDLLHRAGVSSTEDTKSVSPSSQAKLTHTGIMATPLIPVESPSSNELSQTFNTSLPITLTCATAGAAIYYSLNGSSPIDSGTLYTAPITLNKSAVFAIQANKAGMADSAIVNYSYIKGDIAPTPSITPAAGTYATSCEVTITSTLVGAIIMYTIDGSTPSYLVGTPYAAPFTILASATVKAIAYKADMSDSAVASVDYVIS